MGTDIQSSTMRKRTKLIFASVLLCLIVSSCCTVDYSESNYIELKMPELNPVEYVYPFSLEKLYGSISKMGFICLGYCWYNNESPFFNARSGELYKGNNTFDILVQPHWPPLKSYIYYNKEKPIPYSAMFYLHITRIDESKTKVEVITIDHGIITKSYYDTIFCLVKFPEITVIKEQVPPSSIEEYKILLLIGELLGMKEQMPELILPEIPQ